MKKIFLTVLLAIFGGSILAQSRHEMRREISEKWEMTDGRKVAFRQVYTFPGMSQDELFDLTETYFRNTTDNEIEKNREEGYITVRSSFPAVYFREKETSVVYVMAVEFKDDRVRMSVILQSYEVTIYPVSDPDYTTTLIVRRDTSDPADCYPVNPVAKYKRPTLEVFYRAYKNTVAEWDKLQAFINNKGVQEQIPFPPQNQEMGGDW